MEEAIVHGSLENNETFQNYWINHPENFDMAVMECGYEKCDPLHYWGPGSKRFYIIHYVLSGKGTVVINSSKYNLTKGDGFFASPDDVVYYYADQIDPWEYRWVGFTGSKAKNIMDYTSISKTNIYTYTKDKYFEQQLKQIYEFSLIETAGNCFLTGQLYLFLGGVIQRFQKELDEKTTLGKMYVDKAVEYIQTHYSGNCSLMDISKRVGLNRTYIYKLFIRHLGISPTDYIEELRINRACELLKTRHVLIMEAAAAVGYSDQFYFSKVFKKKIGMSPKEYILEYDKNK